jgi:transcriptional regulator with XRE-family HTH domain
MLQKGYVIVMEGTLGQRITDLLHSMGMTQKELAGEVGITDVSMSRYITGERTPKGDTVAKIAVVLHTTADWLLGNEKQDDFESEYYRIHRLIARNASKMTNKQKTVLVSALLEYIE